MKEDQKLQDKKNNQWQNARPTIGLLTHPFAYSFWASMWSGVADVAREQDVNLLCFTGGMLDDPDGFFKQANVLYDLVDVEELDGLIIWGVIGLPVGPERIREFYDRYQSIPIVSVAEAIEEIPSVLADNYGGMRQAIIHLIEDHGCRRIAYVKGQERFQEHEDRYQAYRDVLTEYSLPFNPDLVVTQQDVKRSHNDVLRGKLAVDILVDQRNADFEAIVVNDDEPGYGAINELIARRIQVPGDVLVVGFSDMKGSKYITPPLTTVPFPVYEMGQKATEMLLAQLRGERVPEQVYMPTSLIVRQSCGCLDPTVEQAVVGSIANIAEISAVTKEHSAGEKVEETLVAQRENILAEIEGAVDTALAEREDQINIVWIEQLVDAFVTELKGTPGIFLRELDAILRQVMAINGNVIIWQNAISTLRRQVLPHLDNEEVLLRRAEDIWQQARALIGEAGQRAQGYEGLQTEQQTQLLNEIDQELITSVDVETLMDVLAQNLPRLNIKRCYLSLYEDPVHPADKARLIMAYDEKGRIELEAGGRVFPARQLAPEGMFRREERYSMIVSALYFRKNQLGFVMFEEGAREGWVYYTLRGQISSALQGALLVHKRRQAEETAAKRATELELVAQVSIATSTIMGTSELLQRVVDLTRDSFRLYHAHIYLFNESGDELILAAGAGEVGRQMVAQGWYIPLEREQSLVARAARLRQGVIVNNVREDPDWLPNRLLPDTHSEMAVPLISGERVLGVLDVQADKINSFTEEDVRIQTTLAAQIAVAVENARLFEETQSILTETTNLYQASRRINEANDMQEMMLAIAEAGSVSEINRVVLEIFEPNPVGEIGVLAIMACWHNGVGTVPPPVGTRLSVAKIPYGNLFFSTEPVFFDDVLNDDRLDFEILGFIQQAHIQSMAILPLWVSARQIGILLLEAERVHYFTKRERRLYTSLAGQVAVAVENQRLLAETQNVLTEVEATQRRYTIQAWEAYRNANLAMNYEQTREGVPALGDDLPPEIGQAIAQRKTVLSTNGEKPKELVAGREEGYGGSDPQSLPGIIQSGLAVPLTVRDEVIGVLGLQEIGQDREWSPEEIALVEAIAQQVAQAAENLRLIDETQQRAAREARVNEIGEKSQGAQSLEEALQIAVREVGLSLKAPQTAVQVKVLD